MKKSIERAAFGAGILAACMASAHAQSAASWQQEEDKKQSTEWRFLGPAFSHHSSTYGARIVKPVADSIDCRTNVCYMAAAPAEYGWSETNPALGLEVSAASSPGAKTRDKAFVNLVRDSYGTMSLMLGAGRAWSVGNLGPLEIEIGATGGVWFKSDTDGVIEGGSLPRCVDYSSAQSKCNHYYDFGEKFYVSKLKRVTVPFLLPFISVTETRTGLGVNIALAPKIKLGRYYQVPATTIMLQLTYKHTF